MNEKIEIQEFFLKNGIRYCRFHIGNKLMERKVSKRGNMEFVSIGGMEQAL